MGVSEIITGSLMTSSLSTPGEKVDEPTGSARHFTTIGGTSYEYYPWGKDNKEPHRMMQLLRSNGDISNLLETRTDFLVGSGIGLFQRIDGEVKEIEFELYKEFWMEHDMDELVEAAMTELVNLGCAYICITPEGPNKISFGIKDGLTVRAVKAKDTESRVSKYLLSSRWDEGVGIAKKAVMVPAFDYNTYKNTPASIHCLKKHQTGQFYYNRPGWWSLEEWIRIANRIAGRINNELDSEGNIGMILRVAEKYFKGLENRREVNPATNKEWTYDEIIEAWKKTADEFLWGKSKTKAIVDICGVDEKGQLQKHLEIEPVKRTITGKENNEIYLSVLTAIANSSQILGGLSGISDGKMNSGGGTEIREAANYQQFYRTPRERRHVTNFLNRVFLKYMIDFGKIEVPAGSYFDFKNILVETLDKNPNGQKTVVTNGN